jgi:hypothetical protein
VEGKGDERRGKKRGRGLKEYTAVVCLCGGGQSVGDGQHSACAIIHVWHCVSPLFLQQNVCAQNVCVSSVQQSITLFRGSSSRPYLYFVYPTILLPTVFGRESKVFSTPPHSYEYGPYGNRGVSKPLGFSIGAAGSRE